MQIQQEKLRTDRRCFTESLCQSVLMMLGEEYETELSEVRKNNGVMKEVLYVRKKGSECIPCFYTEELYRSYCDGENVTGLAEHMVNVVLGECDTVRDEIQNQLKTEWIETHMFLRLVQIEKNMKWLEDAVYIPYLDLAAVVYVLTADDDTGVKSFLLPKYMWDMLGKGTPEDCFFELIANTKRLFPECVWQMEAVTSETGEGVDGLLRIVEEIGEGLQENRLYVLSNQRKVNGASVILYPELLKRIYDGFSGNYYVIPSSVHEVLVLKEKGEEDEEYLNYMVTEVNEYQVEPEEILSGHVYYYSGERGLCMCRKE